MYSFKWVGCHSNNRPTTDIVGEKNSIRSAYTVLSLCRDVLLKYLKKIYIESMMVDDWHKQKFGLLID